MVNSLFEPAAARNHFVVLELLLGGLNPVVLPRNMITRPQDRYLQGRHRSVVMNLFSHRIDEFADDRAVRHRCDAAGTI